MDYQDSSNTLAAEIATVFPKQHHLGALFVDMQGAFKNVSPSILLKDLIEMGISTKILNFIKLMYTKMVKKKGFGESKICSPKHDLEEYFWSANQYKFINLLYTKLSIFQHCI